MIDLEKRGEPPIVEVVGKHSRAARQADSSSISKNVLVSVRLPPQAKLVNLKFDSSKSKASECTKITFLKTAFELVELSSRWNLCGFESLNLYKLKYHTVSARILSTPLIKEFVRQSRLEQFLVG